jgi:hypothetical protein
MLFQAGSRGKDLMLLEKVVVEEPLDYYLSGHLF